MIHYFLWEKVTEIFCTRKFLYVEIFYPSFVPSEGVIKMSNMPFKKINFHTLLLRVIFLKKKFLNKEKRACFLYICFLLFSTREMFIIHVLEKIFDFQRTKVRFIEIEY